jgi:hypothetical protein
MPRLPTIRVIGSQDISIRPLPSPDAFVFGAIGSAVPFVRSQEVRSVEQLLS